ncbi:hypothetical protein CF319_g5443 [Tilletia indica]|nr:hypothetical protein CF319_g5443 [Tilletia indica]
MTRKRDYIGVDYAVKQRAMVTPAHEQLKDLLWPGTTPNSVVYVSGYQINEINYSTDKLPREQVGFPRPIFRMRFQSRFRRTWRADEIQLAPSLCVALLAPVLPPRPMRLFQRVRHNCPSFPEFALVLTKGAALASTALCTFDFKPYCISVGHGIIAAGGSQSELAIRPLPSRLSSSSGTGSRGSTATARNAWTLRPSPTGTTVNAISIVPSHSSPPTNEYASSSSHAGPSRGRSNYGISDPYDAEGNPLLPSGIVDFSNLEASHQASLELATAAAVQDLLDEEEEVERARSEMAAAYGYSPWLSRNHHQQQQTGSSSSSAARQGYTHASAPPWPTSQDDIWSIRKSIRDGAGFGSSWSSSHPSSGEHEASTSSCRINVSTNEKTVRSYRVRTPRASALQFERFPGLVPIRTAYFPTQVNHTSTSPDRRTLVAVGDSNDVFLRRISPSGELEDLSTLRASGGGSFSTSWHPSGLQFAVGSSDGRVHVWDIRSSKPLTCLETASSSTPAVLGPGGDGETDAIRTVKYSPCGRMLAYAQHMDAFHVIETVSYQHSQRIAAPQLPNGGAAASSSRNQGGGPAGGSSYHAPTNTSPFNGEGPFVGPDDDDGDGAPEAPPPQLPRHLADRGPSRFHHPNSDPRHRTVPRSRYAAPHPYGWEDVGSGAGGGRGGSGPSSSSSSANARDYGYRSSFWHGTTASTSTGTSSLYPSYTSTYRRNAAAPHSGTNWYSGWGSGSGSNFSSSPIPSGSTSAAAAATSSSLSTTLNDASELGRMARRSRLQATTEEQRAARQAYTYRRRYLLDGRDWTATVPTPPSPAPGPSSSEQDEPESPPPGTRSSAYSAYIRASGGGAGSQNREAHGSHLPPATTTTTTSSSTIWLDLQPEDGVLVLPPTPALPSRQYVTQPFRSRSPFSGAEISPEYLEEIDQQSWSAIHSYQRRLAMPSATHITGLCWEPSGSALYCSTRDVVARYPVLDLRLSSTHSSLI